MDIDFRDIFGDSTPLIRKTKAKKKKMILHQMTKLLYPKRYLYKTKKVTYGPGEDICTSYENGYISKTYKEFIQLDNRKTI